VAIADIDAADSRMWGAQRQKRTLRIRGEHVTLLLQSARLTARHAATQRPVRPFRSAPSWTSTRRAVSLQPTANAMCTATPCAYANAVRRLPPTPPSQAIKKSFCLQSILDGEKRSAHIPTITTDGVPVREQTVQCSSGSAVLCSAVLCVRCGAGEAAAARWTEGGTRAKHSSAFKARSIFGERCKCVEFPRTESESNRV
jgi:hypothetical protein